MSSPSRFKPSISPHHVIGRTAYSGFLIAFAAVALLCGGSLAHSGPCTTQIAELERQVGGIAPGPQSGPTGTQSVGAQLHRQPTPGTVQNAERRANADADAALERARKADADDNTVACTQALDEAKRLYGID